MKNLLQQDRACCQKAVYHRKLACSIDPKHTHHLTQVAATQADALGIGNAAIDNFHYGNTYAVVRQCYELFC
jgi:hypothetical protein